MEEETMTQEMQFKTIAAQYCSVKPEDMTDDMRFREDLGFSSLDFYVLPRRAGGPPSTRGAGGGEEVAQGSDGCRGACSAGKDYRRNKRDADS